MFIPFTVLDAFLRDEPSFEVDKLGVDSLNASDRL